MNEIMLRFDIKMRKIYVYSPFNITINIADVLPELSRYSFAAHNTLLNLLTFANFSYLSGLSTINVMFSGLNFNTLLSS